MADDPEAMSPWGTIGIFGALSWYFVFALGGAGQPHVITKMMMNRRVSDARHILPVSVGAYAVSAMLWISIGLAMRALVLQGSHPSLTSAVAAAPQFLQSYAHPILAGIVFAGLFAAIMSTADGFLNIGAAAVVHDIPRAFRGKPLANELLWARIATVVIAVIAALFALYSGEDLVALLGAFGWGTFAAALVPTVAIGFNWKRATATAANVAIVASLLINFGTKVLGITMPFGIDTGAVSLLVSLTLFFGISLASKPPVIDEDIVAVMDM
jgi:Na+/proline symporter